MEDHFLEECRRELINGHTKKHHPFRFFSLATIHNNKPRQRTVVLRRLLPNFKILFYTDIRSQKVEDLEENNAISALFYHPKKLLQIKIDGVCRLIKDSKDIEPYIANLPTTSRKDYITSLAPGSEIKNPDNVEYLNGEINFCAIQILPKTIEILQLKRPNHIRIQYTLENNEWKGQFLVP